VVGQQQAKLYADCLQQAFGQRPVIFYTDCAAGVNCADSSPGACASWRGGRLRAGALVIPIDGCARID
jgi:type I site-specific restriction endonuclease